MAIIIINNNNNNNNNNIYKLISTKNFGKLNFLNAK